MTVLRLHTMSILLTAAILFGNTNYYSLVNCTKEYLTSFASYDRSSLEHPVRLILTRALLVCNTNLPTISPWWTCPTRYLLNLASYDIFIGPPVWIILTRTLFAKYYSIAVPFLSYLVNFTLNKTHVGYPVRIILSSVHGCDGPAQPYRNGIQPESEIII